MKTKIKIQMSFIAKISQDIVNKVDNFFIENPYDKGLYLILTRYFIKTEMEKYGVLDVDKKEITKNITFLLKQKGIL